MKLSFSCIYYYYYYYETRFWNSENADGMHFMKTDIAIYGIGPEM